MRNETMITLIVALLLNILSGCGSKLPAVTTQGKEISKEVPIAFPGAEGFGKYATGGRGGKVYVVTNLNDAGEGSLRAGLSSKQPVIIVFAVSGTIHLQSPLEVRSNTTIAGQSAPGDGICLADHSVTLKGDNIIIRYMRFRLGDRFQNKGMVHGGGSDDALNGMRRKHIIIDHCSLSWSTDEILSIYAGDSTTVQWNIMAEPLNYSYHFETGDKDFERHGYGGILGGRHISIHHNLYAHCQSRTPRFEGNRNILPEVEFADYRNNVIYNWAGNNVYGGEGGRYNIVDNYYKSGPNTSKRTMYQVWLAFKREDIPFGKFYVNGNYVDGSPDVTSNNWKGVVMDKGTQEDALASKMDAPFPATSVSTQSPAEAYELVLKSAGASYKRDTLDQRIVHEVSTRTGRIIDVQGGYAHGTAYEISKGAWPVLKSLPAAEDRDKDGMPDEWERKNGLNPENAADANGRKLHEHYDNIEVYLNNLLQPVTR